VLAITGFAIVTSLLFASCYWNPQSGTGSITLHISGPASRSITAPTSVSYARVFLYTDNGDTPVYVGESTAFAEAALSDGSGSVTVQNVPAGPQYKLVLVLGTKDTSSGVFLPATFSQTQSAFAITANKDNVVALAAPQSVQLIDASSGLPVPVQYDLIGKNLTGATVANNSNMYPYEMYWAASTSNTLFAATTGSMVNTSYTTVTPGRTINSLSSGSPDPVGAVPQEIWMNTSGGIVTFDPSNGQFPALPLGGPSTAVLLSGSYYAMTAGQDVVYYADNNGLGGVVFGGQINVPYWVTIAIAGVSEPPILDYAVPPSSSSGDYAYFATRLGAFAIGSDLLSSGNNTLTYLLNHAAFFTVVDPNGNNPFINSLAMDLNDTTLYIATNNGIYTAAAANIDGLVGTGSAAYKITSAPLPGTTGHAFKKVLEGGTPASYYSALYWVGWSRGTFVYGLAGGTSATTIPVAAVSLGTPQAVALMQDSDSSYVYLVIAGSEGLSFVPLGYSQNMG